MKISLPQWLKRDNIQLPEWAKVGHNRAPDKLALVIDVDTNKALREWVGLLGSPPLDQYVIECAYQCAKLDLQMALAGTDYDPRIGAKPVEFRFRRAEQWALKKHPVGKGVDAASKGREARGHYVRIRGQLPM